MFTVKHRTLFDHYEYVYCVESLLKLLFCNQISKDLYSHWTIIQFYNHVCKVLAKGVTVEYQVFHSGKLTGS